MGEITTQAQVWNTCGYVRLSREDGDKEESNSVTGQKDLIRDYFKHHPELRECGMKVDDGYTGSNFDRPAFQEMMAEVKAGKFNCIVVKDLSRFGREHLDAGEYIEKIFPFLGVRFIAINDHYDSLHSNVESDELVIPFKNLINEAYAADISKKVKAQQHQAMKDGEFVGARPPYGYKKDPDNCHRLLVNEDTAPVVHQIFQWAVDGVPLNVIVKRLNEAGIMTPGYYHASCGLFSYDNKLAGSGKWQTWTVGKILADEVYTGDMVQGKSKTVGHKQVPVLRLLREEPSPPAASMRILCLPLYF